MGTPGEELVRIISWKERYCPQTRESSLIAHEADYRPKTPTGGAGATGTAPKRPVVPF